MARHRFQVPFRRTEGCIFWGLGFRQSSCSPYRSGPAAPRSLYLDTATASIACSCPRVSFRIQVSHWTQEYPSEFLPAVLGIQQGASWRRAFPLTCDRHGWIDGPWAFPRASHPTDQEPATHVTVGTGRTQTRSYVFDIRRTSSTSSLTTCDLVSHATRRLSRLCWVGTGSRWTSGGPPAPYPDRCAARWSSVTAAV